MNVKLTYVFETKDGFRYERETPEEIIKIVEENYKALKRIAKDGDSVNMTTDYRNRYFPSATISACIQGTWRYYHLRTEVTEIK